MKREHACGVNVVDSLLATHPECITRLWVSSGRERVAELSSRAQQLGIAVQSAQKTALDRMTDGARHQGIVAEFRPPPARREGDLPALLERAGRDALVLVLDQVQDPHNLGACLRSAAAAGAHAVLAPRDRAASLTPAARNAAAGAAERVPLVEVANLARALEQLQKMGLWCVGLAGEAETSVYDTDLTGPMALVLGGEHQGLRQLTRKRCDSLARIPMPGGFESLNVSVAAGIALFEAVRQRAKH